MRLGIDLGGTKTEIAVLDGGREILRRRVPTARNYRDTMAAIAALVEESGVDVPVGIAIPGTETAAGTIKNANSTWLNKMPLAGGSATGTGPSSPTGK